MFDRIRRTRVRVKVAVSISAQSGGRQTSIQIMECADAERRSVGLPGLRIHRVSNRSTCGTCECPYRIASHSGNRAASRSSRPARGPASWSSPTRRPPASRTRSRGNLCATAGSSMLPCTPSTGGPSASSSARNATETKSPRCRIRSAARSRSTHAGGSRREPRGRCVSEMTATPVAAVYRTVKTKLTNTLVRAGFIAARSLTAKTYRPGGTARSKLRTRTL